MRSRWPWSHPAVWFWPVLSLSACPPPSGPQDPTDTASEPTTAEPDSETSPKTTTGPCPVGALGCPCTGGGVCDPGLVCSSDQVCLEPGATTDTETTAPDPSATDTTVGPETTETTTETTTTGEMSLCKPAEGQPNFACGDASKPYCSPEGVCGDCTVLPEGEGCDVVTGGAAPICDPESGECVECTAADASKCTGDTPACNLDTGVCEGCFEHSHCPESACDILKRECFEDNKVLHVRLGIAGQGCVEQVPIGGSTEKPYCLASLAIEHAQQSGSTAWVIKFMETDFQVFYHPNVQIPSINEPQTFAFVHEPGDIGDRHTRFVSSTLGLNLGSEVTLYLDGFKVEIETPPSDQSVGVLCQADAVLYMTDSYITGARGPGIRGLGCDIHMVRSTVYDGWSEGVDVSDGKLRMVNSFITENLYVSGKGGGGITASNSALDIVFSTIANNNYEATLGGDSIHCKGGVVGEVRNSVIARKSMGNNPSVSCPTDANNLKIFTSVVDGGEDLDGDGDPANQTGDNKKLAGEDILKFFVTDKNTGAYKVEPAAVESLNKTAVWKTGDPRADYEGQPRHAKPGEFDVAGGDVP